MTAWLSDIINIECWSSNSKNCRHRHLTLLKSNWPKSSFNQSLTSCKSTFQDNSFGFSNKVVLESKCVISWILSIWINKTISNCHTFEINLQLVLVLEKEVMGDSRNIMSSITFTSDVKVFTLELREFFQEVNHKSSHSISNLFLICIKISFTSSFRESSSYRLVYVKKISIVVP
jgi:hypothetical protein